MAGESKTGSEVQAHRLVTSLFIVTAHKGAAVVIDPFNFLSRSYNKFLTLATSRKILMRFCM